MSLNSKSLGEQIATAKVPGLSANGEHQWLEFIRLIENKNLNPTTPLEPSIADFLRATFATSPFSYETAMAEPEFLINALNHPPGITLVRLHQELDHMTARDQTEVMVHLRLFRRRAMLLVALCDLGGVWSLSQVGETLSTIADRAVNYALNWCWDQIPISDNHRSTDQLDNKTIGYVVLAMGKYGARELNYSSDIDLIVIYDPKSCPIKEHRLVIRLTKRLVQILQERTAEGFVFRVDLRLRPDPNATAIAISLPAALGYYESMGQNWERAAFIKAQAVAGDIMLGEQFLQELQPFIWRKYLDFAAILDIHAMKRQINIAKGHKHLAISGHNIKLGYGGIREIEFFVQTQQLIAGGRNSALRGRKTVEMLDALARAKWLTAQSANELTSAYIFLRMLENRLQIVDDQQTHSLPTDCVKLNEIALMMGFEPLKSFTKALTTHLTTVREHYQQLFAKEADISNSAGNLVFTGGDDDPQTLITLSDMGFTRPSDIAAAIRSWHFGRYPAMRGAKAREQLTELLPLLLNSFSDSGDPDGALLKFDKFLSTLPSGFQFLAILRTNPQLLQLTSLIMGSAPKLGQLIAGRPHTLSALLEPDIYPKNSKCQTIIQHLLVRLAEANSYEDILDLTRIFANEQKFIIGSGLLTSKQNLEQAGQAFSTLAEAIINCLLDKVMAEFAKHHGTIENSAVAIIAIGKLGSKEMSFDSDLDLIIIYDHDPKSKLSNGKHPLDPATYFNRMTKRLLAALSAPTAQGELYQVDMRLRPSGNAGPLATSVQAFTNYQLNDAWDWEHMVLTKARVIAGDWRLSVKITKMITRILRVRRDIVKTALSVTDMRKRIAKEKKTENVLDVKIAPGGLIDIEFIVQFLQLTTGWRYPQGLVNNNAKALTKLSQVIGRQHSLKLLAALKLYNQINQIRDICQTTRQKPNIRNIEKILKSIKTLAQDDDLKQTIHHHQQVVKELFGLIVN